MKKTLVLLLIILFPYLAFSQGVIFEKLSFDEAVTKAKKSGKLVLLDCYTSWCGPCKMMAESVFPQEKVGAYINPRFVALKVDMEKEDGPELRERLGVKAYPTFIIADGEGNVVAKFVGGYGVDAFIEKVESSQKNSFFTTTQRYESGKMSQTEKIDYITILTDAGERDEARKIALSLLENASKKEKLSKEFWKIYRNNKIVYVTTEHFNFILANKKKFDKIVGKKEVDNKIFYNYSKYLVSNIYGNFGGQPATDPIQTIKVHQNTVAKLDMEKKDILMTQFAIAIARAENDALSMAKNIDAIFSEMVKDNLWGYASAFLNVFAAVPDAVNIPEVKKLGEKFYNAADESSKRHYKSMFKL